MCKLQIEGFFNSSCNKKLKSSSFCSIIQIEKMHFPTKLKEKLGDNMKENRFVSYIRRHPVWSIVIVLLFFIVVIPVLINLCYSCNHVFYVTQWNAADVLAYYGTILGTTIAAASLIVTILFTRKQIARENYIRNETEKWKGAEQVIEQALIDICPLNMKFDLNFTTQFAQVVLETIDKEENYSLRAKASLDRIKLYLNPDDYLKIELLANSIMAAIDEYTAIADEISAPYQKALSYLGEKKTIPSELKEALFYNPNQPSRKIAAAHAGSYQNLLNLKRDVFQKIYQSIGQNADQKLNLFCWEENKSQPSNGVQASQ